MIRKALQFTSDILDQFLRNKFGLDERKVILNTIIDAAGVVPQENQNKVVISLINIDQETLQPFYVRNKQLPNGNFAEVSPSERYNLDILITANFDDYSETLKFLNAVILFFQVNTAIDPESYSSIPIGMNRLEFDIEKVSYHEMHSVWTAMGAKYQPSVIYKMRLITLQGDEAAGFTTAINATSSYLS